MTPASAPLIRRKDCATGHSKWGQSVPSSGTSLGVKLLKTSTLKSDLPKILIQAKIRFGTCSWRYSLQVVIQLNIFYPNNWKFSTWICFLSEKTVSFNQTPLQESTDCHSNACWKVTHEFPSKEKYWLCQWTLPVVQHFSQSFAMWCYQKTQAQTKIWEISFNEKKKFHHGHVCW